MNHIDIMAACLSCKTMLDQHGIKINALDVGKYQVVRRDGFGGEKWAIRDGSACYNKVHKDFEYEPLPSGRSELFMAQTRFDSFTESVIVAVGLLEGK